ncbi:hypothetical protein QTP88_024367 [Uroleucon formosanum]
MPLPASGNGRLLGHKQSQNKIKSKIASSHHSDPEFHEVQKQEVSAFKTYAPFKLNTVPGNEDDPSDQLQTINNASGPSTSSASFISPSQSVTSKQCSEPPSKRPRQLKLFGSTKN